MVTLTGRDLTLDQVVAVARDDEPVELSEEAVEAMTDASSLADLIFERGLPTYGLTTGLGAQKRTSLRRDDDSFSWRQIAESHVGQGPEAPRETVRAAMLVLLNQFCGGSTCMRPVIAERFAEALNAGETPPVKSRGSLGASDLAPMADIARSVLAGLSLAPGEGLALINSSAYGTGSGGACAGGHRATAGCGGRRRRPGAGGVRRQPLRAGPGGHAGAPGSRARAHIGALPRPSRRQLPLAGGRRPQPPGPVDVPQHRGDPGRRPRSSRARPGAARPGVERRPGQPARFGGGQAASCLAAAYEVLGLAAALDYVRVVLASVFSSACERIVKLLDTPWSGLPTGLLPQSGPDLGLEHPRHRRAIARDGGQPAGPAGFVHRRQHVRRGGHRGPRLAPASLRAPAERDGRSG